MSMKQLACAYRAKHVCLDKDGVLTDVHRYWSRMIEHRVVKLRSAYGLPARSAVTLSRAMGIDLDTRRVLEGGPVGYKPRRDVIAAAITELSLYGAKTTPSRVAELFSAVDNEVGRNLGNFVKVLRGVPSALKRMKRAGLKLSVYSSDHLPNLMRVLGAAGLNTWIDVCVGGDEVRRPKPDPEGFKTACRRVGVSAQESMYIGDSPDDLRMGKRAAALSVIGVASGLCSKARLNYETPFVFDSLLEAAYFLVEAKRPCITR